jgi:hypothetical protein
MRRLAKKNSSVLATAGDFTGNFLSCPSALRIFQTAGGLALWAFVRRFSRSVVSFKAADFIDSTTFGQPCVAGGSDHNRHAGRSGWGS